MKLFVIIVPNSVSLLFKITIYSFYVGLYIIAKKNNQKVAPEGQGFRPYFLANLKIFSLLALNID